jgi:glycerol-3-phosphate acyltransferase PlsX
VKSHGNASNKAFLAAIEEAIREVEKQVPEKIQATFAKIALDKEHSLSSPENY